jgi:Concanavalin A-like lectin/glucanases superfamily
MYKTIKKSGIAVCILLINIIAANAQDQSLYFNGTNQYAEYSAIANQPIGNAARTIEFWVKVPKGKASISPIIKFGRYGDGAPKGTGLTITHDYLDDVYSYLSIDYSWAGITKAAKIKNNEWTFVAISYANRTFNIAINGELPIVKTIQEDLNTMNDDKNTIGGIPANGRVEGRFFNGGIDNLAIWNTVRTPQQIKQDMINYRGFLGNEPGLVAAFSFNEATGNVFKDVTSKLIGNLQGGNLWTTAINTNPNPIDEGIWFVIQNKSDIDTDLDIPAKRVALSVNEQQQIEMASVPLTGNYDAFLWRTIKLTDGSGRFKLVNKKLGTTYALDCGLTYPTIGNLGDYSGQQWVIKNCKMAIAGTNAYTLSNEFITNQKSLQYADGRVTVAIKDTNNTKQIWLLQPMNVMLGYHIPVETSFAKGFNRYLQFSSTDSYGIACSNTASEWAMLNAHLIYKNILNSIVPTVTQKTKTNTASLKKVILISQYDPSEVETNNTPFIFGTLDSKWMKDFRGGASGNGNTIVTEEMMCKIGVVNRGSADNAYREFEQVIHEFAHATDFCAALNTAANKMANSSAEWFAWKVQYLFNSAQSVGVNANRQQLTIEEKNYLATIYNVANTWLPPRKLTERDVEKTHFLYSGSEILLGQKSIYANNDGTYLQLQQDGNLVVKNTIDDKFRWGSHNNMAMPLGVNKVLFENGSLIFISADGTETKKIGVTAPNSMLLISSDSNPATGNFLKIIDNRGQILWQSN